jgi:hypothetical protein
MSRNPPNSVSENHLPAGISQVHWDEAEKIMQEASKEIAQTLGEN